MENIIKKAIEGGWVEGTNWVFLRANTYWAIWTDGNGTETTIDVKWYMMSAQFWQALGKADSWGSGNGCPICGEVMTHKPYMMDWQREALRFHEINLTEGWDKAVAYLEELMK